MLKQNRSKYTSNIQINTIRATLKDKGPVLDQAWPPMMLDLWTSPSDQPRWTTVLPRLLDITQNHVILLWPGHMTTELFNEPGSL